MRETKLAGLTVRLAGGTDGSGGGDGPCVVLLHGFGAPGEDLVPLASALQVSPALRFAFPAAPLSLPQFAPFEARAWWHIDTAALEQAAASGEARDLSGSVPEGLLEAREQLLQCLDALQQQLGVPEGKLVLGGFSQGAMLACDVALTDPRPLAGLILLSGTLLAQDRWQPCMAARARLPILQSHGRTDPLLPFAAAERLRDLWTQAGAQVEFHAFDGGHELPVPVLHAMAAFLSRVT